MPNSTNLALCPECEGTGRVDGYGAFTSEHLDEAFGDDIAAREAFVTSYKAGLYDSVCPTCGGCKVVVDEVDGTTAAQRWQDELQYRYEVEQERRFGA